MPISGGMFPENWLMDKSRQMSLDREPIRGGMTPKRLLMLRLIYARLGNDENEKLSSVPFTLEFVRFNVLTLPSKLQVIPNQLHGPVLVEMLS
ncbi:hypothetical protein LOK49_LG10G00488 [Camellia lanceoleosa]|uniref:Uncharacterized protein n=1 Tax=Camellia lanceoleosa TaxID=1840588 RepID=A0ACC0G6H3_9ERIC|nr:hypothetical protein LOK49_LG10G00488 [Camellia lanceoleosa]